MRHRKVLHDISSFTSRRGGGAATGRMSIRHRLISSSQQISSPRGMMALPCAFERRHGTLMPSGGYDACPFHSAAIVISRDRSRKMIITAGTAKYIRQDDMTEQQTATISHEIAMPSFYAGKLQERATLRAAIRRD